ncbi:N-acetylornithine carbamoyltransferase [Natronospira proteinivora]|uniref:N-acetylornithine carbamoyltransferase n=1 Tax=Natronospira proteinivora TaxID=1807133 RepID=A0ABT1G8X7_9GAMM|nr:N-acetylornithine carbamoyltransferase [Natronospira proteinivora]MCP1727781.1 N-acetylornithine carbamoyltransferase [Natronospira proteinivora]
MKHLTHMEDLGVAGLQQVIRQALSWKQADPGKHLADALLGMLFFNPSLRTRASFEAVMARGGGSSLVLESGKGAWAMEHRDGIPMDGDRPEHVREAAPVLSRYVDLLAVRSFAALEDDAQDEADPMMRAFRAHATVPLISMESAREHLCQGLADVLTLAERFGGPDGDLKGQPVTLSWAPHRKPLPKAVPNSFLLSAAAAGCEVRLAHPPGFELPAAVMQQADDLAAQSGGSVYVSHDQSAAVAGSRAVYAKAWGPVLPCAGDAPAMMQAHPDWQVDSRLMAKAAGDACFMHCLPVRRDLEVAAELLDSPASAVVDQAENRFHVQRVLVDMALKSFKQTSNQSWSVA